MQLRELKPSFESLSDDERLTLIRGIRFSRTKPKETKVKARKKIQIKAREARKAEKDLDFLLKAIETMKSMRGKDAEARRKIVSNKS